MLMTHAPETGARNRRQKTGVGFWRQFFTPVAKSPRKSFDILALYKSDYYYYYYFWRQKPTRTNKK